MLAGTLHDGDHVDVVASLKMPDNQRPYGRTVLRNIVVVHAPAGPSATSSGSVSTTLRLSDEQAQTLFFVTKNGDWSLVLRPAVHSANSADSVNSITSVVRAGK